MRMWEIREGYEKDGYRKGRGRMTLERNEGLVLSEFGRS